MTANGASASDRPLLVGGSLIAILVLAFVNFVSGGCGLLLAIPPGFATAVFPPSGIGLAALLIWGRRLWPGILLGSVAFNLHLALQTTGEVTISSALPLASSIAIGSTAQALVAVTLVRRFTRAPTRLVEESDILGLLLIGGPLSCLVAASWGVGSLFVSGVYTPGTLAYTWFTWWVGDTIGVLIFTPLVLALCARPRELWRPRLVSVALPLTVAFMLVVMVYVVVSERGEEAIHESFRRRVEIVDRALGRGLHNHVEVLWSIRSYFAGSQDVSHEEFRTFVKRSLAAHPGLTGLGWNPSVTRSERARYEAEITRELGRPFEITSRNADGVLVRAPESDEHVFVRYIEPLASNAAALGFDILSEPIRRDAIERARDSGEPAATQRLALVQDTSGGFGFLLILPIYDTDATPATIEARRAAVRGYAVAVLQIDSLVEAAIAGLPIDGIEFTLFDDSAPYAARVLGQHRRQVGGDASTFADDSNRADGAYAVVMPHRVGGRNWSLLYRPTDAYLADQPTWQAWAVLAAGLGLTGLLGALLLVITGRAILAARRRIEIAGMNRRLEITNEELAGFAYAASHDLRSPLRAISQLAEFMTLDHADAMPEEAREHLAVIRERIARMTKLLDDLLEYSRVGWLQDKPMLVDTGQLVEGIAKLVIEREPFAIRGIDLPEIHTISVPLEQVLRNLCANAIKHHDRDTGVIEVHCLERGEFHEFSVHDDGPGIPAEDCDRVFEMFQRGTVRSGPGGSGIGLSLVRKIVTNRGGRVWIESAGERGTIVRFTWPKEAPESAAWSGEVGEA